MRVTRKVLESKAHEINIKTGSPTEAVVRSEGKLRSNVGHYYISIAYGGYQLERISSKDGGCHAVLRTGHITASECNRILDGILAGLDMATFHSNL